MSRAKASRLALSAIDAWKAVAENAHRMQTKIQNIEQQVRQDALFQSLSKKELELEMHYATRQTLEQTLQSDDVQFRANKLHLENDVEHNTKLRRQKARVFRIAESNLRTETDNVEMLETLLNNAYVTGNVSDQMRYTSELHVANTMLVTTQQKWSDALRELTEMDNLVLPDIRTRIGALEKQHIDNTSATKLSIQNETTSIDLLTQSIDETKTRPVVSETIRKARVLSELDLTVLRRIETLTTLGYDAVSKLELQMARRTTTANALDRSIRRLKTHTEQLSRIEQDLSMQIKPLDNVDTGDVVLTIAPQTKVIGNDYFGLTGAIDRFSDVVSRTIQVKPEWGRRYALRTPFVSFKTDAGMEDYGLKVGRLNVMAMTVSEMDAWKRKFHPLFKRKDLETFILLPSALSDIKWSAAPSFLTINAMADAYDHVDQLVFLNDGDLKETIRNGDRPYAALLVRCLDTVTDYGSDVQVFALRRAPVASLFNNFAWMSISRAFNVKAEWNENQQYSSCVEWAYNEYNVNRPLYSYMKTRRYLDITSLTIPLQRAVVPPPPVLAPIPPPVPLPPATVPTVVPVVVTLPPSSPVPVPVPTTVPVVATPPPSSPVPVPVPTVVPVVVTPPPSSTVPASSVSELEIEIEDMLTRARELAIQADVHVKNIKSTLDLSHATEARPIVLDLITLITGALVKISTHPDEDFKYAKTTEATNIRVNTILAYNNALLTVIEDAIANINTDSADAKAASDDTIRRRKVERAYAILNNVVLMNNLLLYINPTLQLDIDKMIENARKEIDNVRGMSTDYLSEARRLLADIETIKSTATDVHTSLVSIDAVKPRHIEIVMLTSDTRASNPEVETVAAAADVALLDTYSISVTFIQSEAERLRDSVALSTYYDLQNTKRNANDLLQIMTTKVSPELQASGVSVPVALETTIDTVTKYLDSLVFDIDIQANALLDRTTVLGNEMEVLLRSVSTEEGKARAAFDTGNAEDIKAASDAASDILGRAKGAMVELNAIGIEDQIESSQQIYDQIAQIVADIKNSYDQLSHGVAPAPVPVPVLPVQLNTAEIQRILFDDPDKRIADFPIVVGQRYLSRQVNDLLVTNPHGSLYDMFTEFLADPVDRQNVQTSLRSLLARKLAERMTALNAEGSLVAYYNSVLAHSPYEYENSDGTVTTVRKYDDFRSGNISDIDIAIANHLVKLIVHPENTRDYYWIVDILAEVLNIKGFYLTPMQLKDSTEYSIQMQTFGRNTKDARKCLMLAFVNTDNQYVIGFVPFSVSLSLPKYAPRFMSVLNKSVADRIQTTQSLRFDFRKIK